MENTDLGGDFKDLLSNLRWLECSILGKFTPTNFHLKNLLVLDLSRSNIDAYWGGWSQIMVYLSTFLSIVSSYIHIHILFQN